MIIRLYTRRCGHKYILKQNESITSHNWSNQSTKNETINFIHPITEKNALKRRRAT